MEKHAAIGDIEVMVQSVTVPAPAVSVDEILQGWHELGLRVEQLETELTTLEQENKTLRSLLERAIEHRQKSHSELVMLLAGLVSKLPVNDIGVIVSRLVEHNTNVSQYLAALIKGTVDANLAFAQPEVLRSLDQTKRELSAALKAAVEEVLRLDTPLEPKMLQSLTQNPDLFFSPRAARANRCFIKGQVPRERIVREFGEEALIFFNDLTTDSRLNPHPKPEEIVLCFKNEFEELMRQNPGVAAKQRDELEGFYRKVQRSKACTEQARAQKIGFQRLSFIIELLHYYEHQSTEAPDVIFAQRLPALVEQLAIPVGQNMLDEKLIATAEGLLAFVIHPDHRQMIVNNLGKGGELAKTLKYVLKLRPEKVIEPEQVAAEFVKHLLTSTGHKSGRPEAVTEIVRLVRPERQKLVVRSILSSDRLGKSEADALCKRIGLALGLGDLAEEAKARIAAVPVEVERRVAWENIKEMIERHTDCTAVAAAIRERLNAKYDADEIRQSWITLTAADPISLIRIFCQIPYRADGKTDAIARPVIETYVNRLIHDKYAGTYKKVATSLRNMFAAKPDSPTLLSFLALVRWVEPAAANKICGDIGMPIPAH